MEGGKLLRIACSVDCIWKTYVDVAVCVKAMHTCAAQREAKLLKDVNMTRVVAIGIGNDVGRSELYNIASDDPHQLNVIMAPDLSNLTVTNVKNHVVRAICGKCQRFIIIIIILLASSLLIWVPNNVKNLRSAAVAAA